MTEAESAVRHRQPKAAAPSAPAKPREDEEQKGPAPLKPIHYLFLGFALACAAACFAAAFATADYIFYLLPGLAEIVAAAFAYLSPQVGLPSSIVVEAIGIYGLVRSRHRRPLALKIAVHAAYWAAFFALAISGAQRIVEAQAEEGSEDSDSP
jgi:hypothetical protein